MSGEESHGRPSRQLDARHLALLLCFIALAIALLPYASAGFYNDDVFNSAFPGVLRKPGASIWGVIRETNHSWTAWSGRFFPTGIVTGCLIWAFAAGHTASRLVHLAFITANLALGAHLLRLLTSSRAIPLLFLAVVPAFFQVRDYHDPMTSYSPLLQQVVLLVLLTVQFFLKFLASGRLVPYVISLLCYAAVLTTYELGIVAIFPVTAAALFLYRQRRKRGIVGLAGHLVVTFIVLAINLYLKAHAAGNYTGTDLRMGSQSSVTFWKQFVAAIPLSHTYFDPLKLLHPFPWPTAEGSALAVLLFLASAGAILLALRLAEKELPANVGVALFLGGTLLVLPAVIIAQSAKYQDSLQWGWGHVPVYVQFFGLAIIVATACGCLSALARRKLGRNIQITCGLLFALITSAVSGASFMANRHMVEYRNRLLRYPREFVEAATERGLLKGVPNGSIILRDSLAPWDLDAFYAMHGKRTVHVLTPQEWLADQPDNFYATRFATTPVFALDYKAEPRSGGAGWALLSQVKEVSYRKKGKQVTLLGRTVRNPVAYLQEGDGAHSGILPAIVDGWLLDGDAFISPVHADLAAIPPTKTRDHWRNTRLPAGRYRNLRVENTRGPALLDAREIFLLRDAQAPRNPLRTEDALSRPTANPETTSIAGIVHGCNQVDDSTISCAASRDSAVELKTDNIPNSLGLAFLVRPEDEQAAHATLASNRSTEARGLILEQDGGADPTRYTFMIGSGTASESVGSFSLPPDRWSLVIISVGSTGTRLEVSGPDGEVVLDSPKVPAHSDADAGVLRLGNALAGDRAFSGQFSSVILAPQPLDAQQRAAMTTNYEKRHSSVGP